MQIIILHSEKRDTLHRWPLSKSKSVALKMCKVEYTVCIQNWRLNTMSDVGENEFKTFINGYPYHFNGDVIIGEDVM